VAAGGSDADEVVDHHVAAFVNGTYVGETVFDAKLPHRLEAVVPASALGEGKNELTVRTVGDTGVFSLVFLDRFEVDYPQASVLRGGTFEGAWSEEGTARIALPVGTGAVSAVDVTDPARPLWLVGLDRDPSGSVGLRVATGRRYLLAAAEGLLVPRIAAPLSSSLRSGENQADYVLIAPQAFLGAAQALLDRRETQGLRTRAVSLEEIASVFGHGEASGEAIRDFLTHAFHSWRQPSPRYVVLLGDASYDPRHFNASSSRAAAGAFLKTSYLVTASDPCSRP
jgi:hypothetical protein